MENQTEEQQIEQLKEWWKDNGTPLIVGAVLGLSGFFGWKYLDEKKEAYNTSASDLYIELTEELEKADKSQLVEKATAVKEQFSDTSYAILSAYQLAKVAVEKGDLDAAAAEFNWVITHHSNNQLASIAKIRLARILIAQQKAEQALSLLSFDSDSGYFEIASLVKGNALASLGKNAEALEAYKAAENAGKITNNHPSLKYTIESLTAAAVNGVSSESSSSNEVEKEAKQSNTNDSKEDESNTKNESTEEAAQ